jgi:hypothetical protein
LVKVAALAVELLLMSVLASEQVLVPVLAFHFLQAALVVLALA